MAQRKRRTKRAPSRPRIYSIVHLGKAKDDARKLSLNEGQCFEVEQLAQRLERFGNERETWDLPIQKVDKNGGIFVLTDFGRSFGRTKVDIYFAPVEARSEIVVLGVCEGDKENRPWYRIARMRNRFAHYLRIVK